MECSSDQNMSIKSNMEYSMADLSSEVVNEYVVESSWSMTNLTKMCSLGLIWTSVWLIYLKKEPMIMESAFMYEDSSTNNMFNRSNMDYCMADVSLEGLNEYIIESSWSSTLGPDNMSISSNMDFCMAEVTSEGVNEYV